MVLAATFSALTCVASAAFAGLVARRWVVARRPHQALWAASLALFAFAALLEVLAAWQGWGAWLYKAYFVATGVMVGLMAAGTAHLVGLRLGGAFTAYTLVLGQVLLLLAVLTPADAVRLAAANATGEVPTRVLGTVSTLHALLDVPAALLLIAAPLLGWRASRRPHQLLIAAGAVVFTGVHTLASGAQTGLLSLGGAAAFNAGSLLGVLLLFAGYAWSRESPRPPPQAVAASG